MSFRGCYTNIKTRIVIFIGFAIVLRRFIVYSLILTRIVILDPNIFSFSDLFAFVTLYLASTLSWHTKIWSQHVFQILLLPFHRFLLVGYVINGLLVTWWHDLSWTKYFFVLYNIFIIIQIYQTHVGLIRLSMISCHYCCRLIDENLVGFYL